MAPPDEIESPAPGPQAATPIDRTAAGLAPPAPGGAPPVPGILPPDLILPPPPGSGRRWAADQPFLDVPGAPPVTKRDGGAWLLLAAGGFVAGQAAALFLVEVMAAILGHTHNLAAIGRMAIPPEWYVASSLVGLWVGFFGAPWLASRVRGTGRLVADLGLRFKWIDLVGILVGIGGQLLVAALYAPFVKHLHNFSAPTQKLTGGSHGAGFVLIAVLTVVGAPFLEELFFRGLVFRALARVCTPSDGSRSRGRLVGVGVAVVLDGLLFGLAHAEWEQFAGLALFGMVLAVISYRTGRLGMNMVSHASFNLVAVIAVLGTRGVIH